MMKSPLFRFMGRRILPVTILFLSAVYSTSSQESTVLIPDSTALKSIPMDRIPFVSGETIGKATRMAGTLIKQERIAYYKRANDSLMIIMDSLLAIQKRIDLSNKTNRVLRNLLTYWNANKTILEKEKEKLSGSIKSLNDKITSLEKDYTLWENTLKGLDPATSTSTVSNVINKVLNRVDSVKQLINTRTVDLFLILNNTTARSVQAEDVINDIRSSLEKQQDHFFRKTQPSLIEIDYTAIPHWNMKDYLRQFDETDISMLSRYMQMKQTVTIYFGLFLIGIIVLFLFIKQKILRLDMELTSNYEFYMKEILSKPISAALVLGLFASILFFTNRPLVFTDIITFAVSIPLIIVLLTVVRNIRLLYIYLFVALLLLRFVNYLLPHEMLMHRLINFSMGGIEIYVLIDLIRYIRRRPLTNRILNNFVVLFLWIHIGIVVLGMLGNIIGSTLLADLAVNITVSNAFIGILIYISAIIVIGLVHFTLDSNYMNRLKVVRNYGGYLKKQSIGLAAVIGIMIWLVAGLRMIGIYDNIYDYFQQLFSNEYRLGSTSFTIGSIVLFFFVIWLSVIVSKIIRVILEEDILDRFSLKKGVPRMIAVMTRYTLVVIGVFIAVSAAGMPLDQLTIIFGAFSVGIGFGLQNIFNNLVSGLILLFERPIQIGDVVEVGSLLGTVKSMGIRSSNVRTFDGAEVIVPNGHLISNEVTNWTLSDKRRRIEIFSGVAYGSDVHKVQKIFLQLLDEHPDIIKDPPPMVYFNDMGESSLDFRVLFWTDNFDDWQRIRSEIVFKIHDVLYENRIEIPFPQRDLHIKTVNGKLDLSGGKK